MNFMMIFYRSNKGKNGQNGNTTASTTIGTYVGTTEEEEENEGLALLIPNIQETARIVKIATDRLQLESGMYISLLKGGSLI